MNEVFFKIIVPNYNNALWIGRCLDSIRKQTFADWKLIVIDDCSTDQTAKNLIELQAAMERDRVIPIFLKQKAWNGGARNIGIKTPIKSEYTIFVDSDDCLKDENCLKDLHDFIIENKKPDCIRIQCCNLFYCWNIIWNRPCLI